MGSPEIQIPIFLLLVKELVVKGSFRYGVRGMFMFLALISCVSQPGDYPLAIALAAQGKIDLKPLVTHR